MSKKAILITLVSTTCLVFLVGLLSFWMWQNQPTADVITPPVPAEPSGAAPQKPPVPPIPRIAGDAIDDGIVDALDINGLIVHWQEANQDYNVADTQGTSTGIIDSADVMQAFSYWKCFEGRTGKECPYIQ